MRSPFPGLDPYVEPFWSGIHTRMIVALCDQLTGQLPEGLWADVEETVVVEVTPEERTYVKPDAAIFDAQPWDPKNQAQESGIAVAEPLVVDDCLEQKDREILIIDTTTGDSVVTAIELLSPANKLGTENRARYIAKRNAYRAGGANLVEIDLIRSGEHIVGAPEHTIPASRRNDRIVSIHRHYALKWEIYSISLREALPAFWLPLRPGDGDVILQLQPAFEEVFEKGGYFGRIDYSREPEPRLPESDTAWADELLCEEGIRTQKHPLQVKKPEA